MHRSIDSQRPSGVVDPVDVRPRWRRLVRPATLVSIVAGLSLALHLRDPHRSTWVVCPWEWMTGTDCPACGGLRAVNDLTHLKVADAASANLLFIASLPMLALWFGRWTIDSWNGVSRAVDRHRAAVTSAAIGAVVIVWWVVRNLPGLEWLRA